MDGFGLPVGSPDPFRVKKVSLLSITEYLCFVFLNTVGEKIQLC